MAEDVKADELVDQLRDSFNQKLRDEIKDLPAHQALQLADALALVQLDVLAGMRVSYKAAPKVDVGAVAADWMRGMSITELCQKHNISKATAYRLHPAGGRRKQSAI